MTFSTIAAQTYLSGKTSYILWCYKRKTRRSWIHPDRDGDLLFTIIDSSEPLYHLLPVTFEVKFMNIMHQLIFRQFKINESSNCVGDPLLIWQENLHLHKRYGIKNRILASFYLKGSPFLALSYRWVFFVYRGKVFSLAGLKLNLKSMIFIYEGMTFIYKGIDEYFLFIEGKFFSKRVKIFYTILGVENRLWEKCWQ